MGEFLTPPLYKKASQVNIITDTQSLSLRLKSDANFQNIPVMEKMNNLKIFSDKLKLLVKIRMKINMFSFVSS